MPGQEPIDVLFVCELGLWPFDQGYRVHGSQMARALSRRGLRVRVATIEPIIGDAPPWLKTMLVPWPTSASDDDVEALVAGWGGSAVAWRRRVAAHQGVDASRFAGIFPLVRAVRPRLVIGLGQHSPMMMRPLARAYPGLGTLWYAADELAWFQLSCLRREGWRRAPARLRSAAVYALLERLFARGLGGVITVSPTDARLMRWIGGVRDVAMIRNGVDADYFSPSGRAPEPRSLVFWGRMDFEPNVDAVCWFARCVWPRLRERHGDARWWIVGKRPTAAVQALERHAGVTVTGAVVDVRSWAQRAAVTVLPMRCGGGIKNKLLEAAAMGLPIVASPRAVRGLTLPHPPPVTTCRRPNAWIETIERLWHDAGARQRLGDAARSWVQRTHDWDTAALELVRFTRETMAPDPGLRTTSRPVDDAAPVRRAA